MRHTSITALMGLLLCCFISITSAIASANTALANAQLNKTKAEAASVETKKMVVDYKYVDPLQRDTPRGTLRGFTAAAAYDIDYIKAAQYLDVRYLPDTMNAKNAAVYAEQLQAILDRNIWINLEEISDDPNGNTNDNLPTYRELFGTIEIQGEKISLVLQKVPSGKSGSVWKVSNTTVAKIPQLYSDLGYGPLPEWFIEHTPEGRFFKLNIWEWALLSSYLIVAFIIVLPITWLTKWLVLRSNFTVKNEIAKWISRPLRVFLALSVNQAWLANTELTARASELMENGVLLILSIMWLVWSLISVFQSMLREHLLKKGNKQGASLLRPLVNFVRVIVFILAILIWLESLGFNASAILAGMGIGGIAIALASKQSIENLIGTMTLYSAAPIRVGNLCQFGSMRGTVEEIGLRCTRIRTLDRTVIHVPNAKLAEMEIENISEREKIRFKTDIRLPYSTNTTQLKAIIADIKALLENHEDVLESPLRVTFKGFGLHGLEINVFAYVGTQSFPTYQAVAEELQLRIMEIVEEHGSKIIPVQPYVQPAG
ncbi:mechanosensitive ion channel family protein [Colwellia sp. D2M02]|uniref:mechanosensitive ion channel family protein n=1 Tax=Colwellia sp. D2M02 TaxID=2841562 RepID=UPI00209023F4|nr:mechanosensitive ion channel family protein [Colwellia sp. D2M02]